MKNALKHAGKVAAGMLPAALLAGLGITALGALVFLAVLVLGVVCWIISSGDRSDRVTRMILARWGDASCLPHPHRAPLDSPAEPVVPPALRPRQLQRLSVQEEEPLQLLRRRSATNAPYRRACSSDRYSKATISDRTGTSKRYRPVLPNRDQPADTTVAHGHLDQHLNP